MLARLLCYYTFSMLIYVGHVRKNYDYLGELYLPIRNSFLNLKHKIVFPYEDDDKPIKSKELLQKCDLFIAEVSFPSTGLGMEIGWAHIFETPILCIYKKGSMLSSSLKVVTSDFIEYDDSKDLLSKLARFLDKK